ncbi:Rrf2 family transcriptional regulator [Pararoseomonas sp. SCSIO 73927]|uniref:RrF2 family transcriptional regulator n=1 Tax=Pararoseomonas sp. SCSIO 73927 TaxID=3114537 RepID=UPI0030D43D28
MLTQKAKYGLRALAILAQGAPESPTMTILDIALRAHAPHKFLEAILLDLRRHGFVFSRRGKAGGYGLAQPPRIIRVGDIIRAIDGPLAPIPCASLTAYRACLDCPRPQACAIQRLMRQVRDATATVLDGTSLAELAAHGEAVLGDDPDGSDSRGGSSGAEDLREGEPESMEGRAEPVDERI